MKQKQFVCLYKVLGPILLCTRHCAQVDLLLHILAQIHSLLLHFVIS